MTASPRSLLDAYLAAFRSNDAEAVVALFDDNAVFLYPPLRIDAHGKEEIRAAYEALFALGVLDIEIEDRWHEVEGSLAYSDTRATITITAADGTSSQMAWHGTEVAKRQEDGTWRYVLDRG